MKSALQRILATLLVTTAPATLAFAEDTARDAAERTTGVYKPGLSIARGERAAETDDVGPPLYEGIGTMGMAVRTANAMARRYFDQGLSLAYAFNHAEARRSFRAAQRHDPSCAMCFWGEAYALGGNINDPMHAENLEPARRAIGRAMALREEAGAKERAMIEALALRYGEGEAGEREAAWADAIGAAADAWPDEINLQVLAAEALMNLQPWDYWEADATTPKGRAGEIVARLETALAADGAHPAAIHFYIHAVEASATPERAEPYADRLRGAIPALGHLVHMPAHIYMRVGRHADLMAVNRDAAAADERMLELSGETASPIYRYGYYPHNVHFLLVGAMNAGLPADAYEAAAKLDSTLSDEVMRRLAWTQLIKTSPYAVHAAFSHPEAIMRLERPDDSMPLVVGWWRYARGVALARSGRTDAARTEAAALADLAQDPGLDAIEAQFVPARAILTLARHVVEARAAAADGDLSGAEARLREAIAVEDALPYMEPPFWHYPVRQTLGAVLLRQGRADEAVASFAEALGKNPRSGWVLWGLAEARSAAGDRHGALKARSAFEKAWLGEEDELSMQRL